MDIAAETTVAHASAADDAAVTAEREQMFQAQMAAEAAAAEQVLATAEFEADRARRFQEAERVRQMAEKRSVIQWQADEKIRIANDVSTVVQRRHRRVFVHVCTIIRSCKHARACIRVSVARRGFILLALANTYITVPFESIIQC
jgi:hypothetical protein